MQVRPRVLILLVALASAVAQAFGRFSYALLLPAINRDLLDSYAVAGLVATANVTAYLLGTRGRQHAVPPGSAGRADPGRPGLERGGPRTAHPCRGAAELSIGLTLTGVGGAFIWVPAPGLAGSVVRPSRRGAAIGIAGSGIGGGIVFASALTWGLQAQGGDASWRTVYQVETAIALVALVLCLLLLRPAPHRDDDAPVRAAALRRVPDGSV